MVSLIAGKVSDDVMRAIQDRSLYKKWPIRELLTLSKEICESIGVSPEFPLLPRGRIGSLGVKWRTSKIADAAFVDYSPILVSAHLASQLETMGLKGLLFNPIVSSGRKTNQEMLEMVFTGVATHTVSDEEIVLYHSLSRGDDRASPDFARCSYCGLFKMRSAFAFGTDRIVSDEDFFVMRDFGHRYVSELGRESLELVLPGAFKFQELLPYDPTEFDYSDD